MSNKLLLFGVERACNLQCYQLTMKLYVHRGHVQWIVSAMKSCYHIIPEKNDLCCFGCVTSSLLHGVLNW